MPELQTKVDINLRVTAPHQIDVPLVREDHLRVSLQYRTFFEVALAIFTATLGAYLSGLQLQAPGWGLMIASGLATIAFFWFSVRWRRRARLHSPDTESSDAETSSENSN